MLKNVFSRGTPKYCKWHPRVPRHSVRNHWFTCKHGQWSLNTNILQTLPIGRKPFKILNMFISQNSIFESLISEGALRYNALFTLKNFRYRILCHWLARNKCKNNGPCVCASDLQCYLQTYTWAKKLFRLFVRIKITARTYVIVSINVV